MHRVLHFVKAAAVHGVAQLVRHFVDGKSLAAELEHLWHERQVLQLAPLVQGRYDFVGASHLDEVADA